MRYFDTDDGSLPEIEIAFATTDALKAAFRDLFTLGAIDSSKGEKRLWMTREERELPFTGAGDVELMVSGTVDAFHVVLEAIEFAGTRLPQLGFWVDPNRLTVDYRMGEWNERQISSLLGLLCRLRDHGGRISVPWWGEDGEAGFLAAIASRETHGEN
jgi:hypothetical protein